MTEKTAKANLFTCLKIGKTFLVPDRYTTPDGNSYLELDDCDMGLECVITEGRQWRKTSAMMAERLDQQPDETLERAIDPVLWVLPLD